MASLDFEIEKRAFQEYWDENYETLESAKEELIAVIWSILSEEVAISSVYGRVKDREECIEKFSKKYQGKLEEEQKEYEIKDYIDDLVGLRVVALYEADIEKIKDTLSKEFELIDVTDKISAVESKEDSFGYKGLHLDLRIKSRRNKTREYSKYKGLKFEVQIRTIIQDAWSVLDHKIKYKKSIPANLRRRINTLAALFELADREFYSIKKETDSFQAREKEKSKRPSKDEELNAFSFLAIAEKYFQEYHFTPRKVDDFVEELIAYGPITPEQFDKIISTELRIVEKYKQYLGVKEGELHAINPYTEMRHILYKSDNKKYQKILYKKQREQFEKWLSKHPDRSR